MSMHHPMLQPVSWEASDAPETARKNMAPSRSRVYELVWHTALACAMRPPVLQHTRFVWAFGDFHLAAATRKPLPQEEGYFKERTDFPPERWPLAGDLPRSASWQLTRLEMRPVEAPTVGEFLQGLATARIATAGGLHKLWDELSGESDRLAGQLPSSHLELQPAGDAVRVQLSKESQDLVHEWRERGLLGQLGQRNGLLDSVEAGETSWRDAARALAGPELEALADTFSRQIDEVCRQWQGLSRGEGLIAVAGEQAKPPHFGGLPAWMDPEELLPDGHPLRALRGKMEASLALDNPNWRTLLESERALKRLAWLRNHRRSMEEPVPPELDAALTENTGRYSALRYWLTGLQG